MKLDLRVISFECAHLDDSGLLEEVEAEFLALHLTHALHDLSQGVYDVDQVVALVKYLVHQLAGLGEPPLEAGL
jgi:hypothetical protein